MSCINCQAKRNWDPNCLKFSAGPKLGLICQLQLACGEEESVAFFLWQQIAVILTTRWYEIYAAGPPGIWVASNLLGWTNVLLVVSKSLHRINHRLRSNLKDNLADQFQMLIYPFVFSKFERRFLTINLWDIFICKDGYADLIGMSKEGLCVSDFF